MPFTPTQLTSFQIVVRLVSSASIISNVSIILSYIFIKRYQTQINKLVLFMTIADLFASWGYVMGDSALKSGSQDFCNLQGLLIVFGNLAYIFWQVSIALHCFLVASVGKPLASLTPLIRYYHIFSWGLAFSIALTAYLLQFSSYAGGVPMFGNSTFYCWISSSYSIFRIIFYYGVLWLAWALTAVIYGLVWRALKNSSTNLNVSVSTAGSGCTTATTTTANSNIKSHARFISKATCYLVAFMLVRTPGTINRIQGMAAPTNPIFALYMLHALFSPMQGLLNMLVYYYFAIVRDQEIKSRSTTHEGVDQIKGSITSISKPPGLGAVC